MAPLKSAIHPAVDGDFGELFRQGLKASAGQGWLQVREVWLRKGLPASITHEVINAFGMQVIDEFGIAWIFGWREADKLLVLFGVRMQQREPVERAIDQVRARVEGWK